jgi:hypothetical protein
MVEEREGYNVRAPPICFALDVAQDDVLDRSGHTGDLPRD